jgi:hypothetical protein
MSFHTTLLKLGTKQSINIVPTAYSLVTPWAPLKFTDNASCDLNDWLPDLLHTVDHSHFNRLFPFHISYHNSQNNHIIAAYCYRLQKAYLFTLVYGVSPKCVTALWERYVFLTYTIAQPESPITESSDILLETIWKLLHTM